MSGIENRFAADAQHHATTLRALGLDARVGEVRGEYCPGAFTVNARGERKLIGSAQRLVRGGWLLSTMLVADGSERLRAVLEDVYAALELDWDPATVGSVADEAPGVGIDTLEDAVLRRFGARCRLFPGVINDQEVAAAARELARYQVPPA